MQEGTKTMNTATEAAILMDGETRKLRMEATLTEYRMLREEMKMFLGFHRTDTKYLCFLLAALIGAYASQKTPIPSDVFALIVPSLIFLYTLIQVYNFCMVSAQAKACARIEKRINNLFGDGKVMDWQSEVAPVALGVRQSPIPFMTAVFIVSLLGVFVKFALVCKKIDSSLINFIHIVEIVSILIAIAWWIHFEFKGKLPPVEPDHKQKDAKAYNDSR
jgi:hypothetical protein